MTRGDVGSDDPLTADRSTPVDQVVLASDSGLDPREIGVDADRYDTALFERGGGFRRIGLPKPIRELDPGEAGITGATDHLRKRLRQITHAV
jgi:hypothetical protein